MLVINVASMHILRKGKRNNPRILQRNSKSFVNIEVIGYKKVNVNLSDSQLNKLKSLSKIIYV